MKIFITGGAGYIGSHTCVELLKRQHDVLVFDNLVNSSIKSLDRIKVITNRELGFIKGDIRDTKTLKDAMKKFKPEIVIHFAGLKSVSQSVSDPLQYYDTNVYGSINLFNTMNEVGCNKIVFSSSATVYGREDNLPYNESSSVHPTNPYGRSKLIVENILRDWVNSNEHKQAICLRYFNPVGAHESGLIGENPLGIPNNIMPLISQVAAGIRPKLSIFGSDYKTRDGTGERDYVHVVDLALGHATVVEKINKLDVLQVLNLGTGKGTTVKELIETFEKASGKKIPIEFSKRRPGDVAQSWTDPRLAKNLLNLEFNRSVEDMCLDTWRWQSNNPDGYLSG